MREIFAWRVPGQGGGKLTPLLTTQTLFRVQKSYAHPLTANYPYLHIGLHRPIHVFTIQVYSCISYHSVSNWIVYDATKKTQYIEISLLVAENKQSFECSNRYLACAIAEDNGIEASFMAAEH